MAIEKVDIDDIRINQGRLACQGQIVANGRLVQAGFNFKVKRDGPFFEILRRLGEVITDEVRATFEPQAEEKETVPPSGHGEPDPEAGGHPLPI